MLEPLVEAASEPVATDPPGPESLGAVAARPSAARHAPALAAAPAEASTDEAAADGVADAIAEAGEPAGAPSDGPGLSLSQLGVGQGNPFMRRTEPAPPPPPAPATAREEKTARVKRRLDRALAQGLLSQDTASGRGAGSPVMRSLEAAVYASSAPLNGQASFVFVIDGDGKLVSSSVGHASGDREVWSRVARQTAQALAQKKLSVPKGKSVRLTVAVSSHLELPSGADPGVAVSALGIPLKKGGGPRSTKVDLLNPLNPLAPLSLLGDPADIGAKARRMVHAHVVSEELL